jgi:hypothetical protein
VPDLFAQGREAAEPELAIRTRTPRGGQIRSRGVISEKADIFLPNGRTLGWFFAPCAAAQRPRRKPQHDPEVFH